ncbi:MULTISPECIES: putative ABC transporter permease [unclassified Eubacterium (in: firmicutes)]|uniref:putative ABC transporter permease n=1 Tax=Eubacterium TaxID=1730 RepID=UPI000E4DBFA1|nr:MULTISPECIES: hypothetical protein [unclassified Eubacterium (in: firmicutes)]RHR72322.1 hypothetical protein DWW68_07865 [Eubacterium sp. AF16-48]RHR79894.1 hypothetical protein DWW50_05665 [Eubacterium sp. AF15-50]
MFSFSEIALLFFIYSFLGWCVEVAFVAVTAGKVTNRGFLNGPVCPIYGCGMIGVLLALLPVEKNIWLLFLGGMVICSAVELFGGWILDKIFHMRWWDYSDEKFNIGGYVCLAFSFMWGMAVVFAVKFVHHPIMAVVKKIPFQIQVIIVVVCGVVFVVDMIVTLKNLIGINKSLGQLDKLAESLHAVGDQLKDVVGNSAITVAEKAEEGMEILDEKTADSREKIAAATESSREKIAAATENSRERIAGVREESAERIAKQLKELEEKRDAIMESLQKNVKHRLNTPPTLNKSGKSINIVEYIKDYKNKNTKTND